MNKNHTFLIITLFFILSSFSQSDFRPGYIINKNNDTIYGKIDYRGDLLMGNVCTFQDKANGARSYGPTDIKGYRLEKGKLFSARELGNGLVFMEKLNKGALIVFYYRDASGNRYFIEDTANKLVELPFKKEIKYIRNRRAMVPSTIHIGILKYRMRDAPELANDIEKIGRPSHTNLVSIARAYHQKTASATDFIVYEEQPPKFTIFPELIGGISRYQVADDVVSNEIKDQNFAQYGLILHAWLPWANEKLFLRTGVMASTLEFERRENDNILKIPFQFEYQYPKGTIQPRLAYGLNLYVPGSYSVSFNAGIQVKVANKLYLTATAETEFEPTTLLVPSGFLGYSFYGGLMYKWGHNR